MVAESYAESWRQAGEFSCRDLMLRLDGDPSRVRNLIDYAAVQ